MSLKECRKRYSITITTKDFEETIEGTNTEEVFRGVVKALSQHLPLYKWLSKLSFKPDYERILTALEGRITFFSGGNFIIEFGSEVPDFDTILTCLMASYMGYELNLCEKNSLTINQTYSAIRSSRLHYSRKTVNNRLLDLTKMNLANRVGRGEYKVTELGIKYFLEHSIPIIKGER